MRLLAGATMFAACMVAPTDTVIGSFLVMGVAAVWIIACWPPVNVVGAALLFGLALFLPYFLLMPLIPVDPSVAAERWQRAFLIPWSVLLRGLSGMLISIGTATSLSTSDLREGLARLPVPTIVTAILLQIVHQTATLFYETRRVALAVAVRGASGGSVAAWRVLFSLPRVWLPRIIGRAERVAAAMELRGYCDGELRSFQRVTIRVVDGVVLALAVGVLGCAVIIRFWSIV
jgi:energy-coupling factor transporter transmembrane protein EcfT